MQEIPTFFKNLSQLVLLTQIVQKGISCDAAQWNLDINTVEKVFQHQECHDYIKYIKNLKK